MKLYDHQQHMVEFLRTHKRWLLSWEMGSGKTITLLSVCAERPMRTLVLCPRSVMRAAWLADAEHFPGLDCRCLWHQSRPKRSALIAGGWDLGVINFESFKSNYRELAARGVRRLIVDESSRTKNHTSGVSRTVVAFSDTVEECYLLSGTPAPNNGTEYWPQLRCVSRAASGESFYGFAGRFFVPQKRKIAGGHEVVTGYRPIAAAEQEFSKRLASCSSSLRKEDCLDLPDKIDKLVEVELSPAETEAYRAVEKELRLISAGGVEKRVKAEAVLTKARQITGGSVLVEGSPVDLGTSKIGALLEVLEEAGDQPAVIWAEFTAQIDRIAAAVSERGPTAVIDGRTSGGAAQIVADFQSGRTRYLVCHPQAAGHGITLTAASLAVYYSLSFSSELHLQSRDRIHRAGQTRHCVYVYLLAKETVDWSMLRSLRGKKSRADAISDALRAESGAAAPKRTGALIEGR